MKAFKCDRCGEFKLISQFESEGTSWRMEPRPLVWMMPSNWEYKTEKEICCKCNIELYQWFYGKRYKAGILVDKEDKEEKEEKE